MGRPLVPVALRGDPAARLSLQRFHGLNFAVGQLGPVWFTAWAPPVTVRNVTLPAGTALLATDISWDSLSLQLPAAATPEEIEAQREFLAEYVPQHQANHEIEIDGVPIKDVSQYLIISTAFDVALPQAVADHFGIPAGEYGPELAGGYFCYCLRCRQDSTPSTLHGTSWANSRGTGT